MLRLRSNRSSFEIQTEFETAQKTAELLEIYREGLVPQAHAEFAAAVAAYQNNRQDFPRCSASFLDVFHIDRGVLAKRRRTRERFVPTRKLTGMSLHEEGASR